MRSTSDYASDAYSSTSYSLEIQWLPPPEVCRMEVGIKTTFSHMINIAGIIYYTYSVVIDIQSTRYKNACHKRFQRTVCQNKFATIYSKKFLTRVSVMRCTSGYVSI